MPAFNTKGIEMAHPMAKAFHNSVSAGEVEVAVPMADEEHGSPSCDRF
jgi:hypothetical protein